MYFYLYRIKAYRSLAQKVGMTRTAFFDTLVNKKPSKELRQGYKWHIGNVVRHSPGVLVFAVGRTTKSSVEKYDEKLGDFVQGTNDESPYTTVVVDEENGVLAIGYRAKLSPTTKGIANSLQKLLNTHAFTMAHRVRFELAEIVDPEGFIKSLEKAHEVVGFTMHFSEPNPFDVQQDFHMPMERLLEHTGGDQGVTSIKGENLDKSILSELTRSVAATGNTASARVRDEPNSRPATRKFEGETVSVKAAANLTEDAVSRLVKRIRQVYKDIRGN